MSVGARPLGPTVGRWYDFNTANHEIWVGGVRYSDYIEIDHHHPVEQNRAEIALAARNEMERHAA